MDNLDLVRHRELPISTECLTENPTKVYLKCSLWRKRTFLEKVLICYLIFITAIFLLTVIIFIGKLKKSHHLPQLKSLTSTSIPNVPSPTPIPSNALTSTTFPEHPRRPFCTADNCITEYAAIIKSANTTVNPCKDFYSYACGGWIEENPNSDGSWSVDLQIQDQMAELLEKSLDAITDSTTSTAEETTTLYYRSCLDEETLIDKGETPLLDFIKDVGGSNITHPGNWSDTKWNFQRTLEILHNKYSMRGLFSWDVEVNPYNSSSYCIKIYLSTSDLTLQHVHYYDGKSLEDPVLQAFKNYMMEIIGTLAPGNNSDMEQQLTDIIKLEMKLAKMNKVEFVKMNITTLQTKANFIHWNDYFKAAFNYTLDDSHVFRVSQYILKLSKLIELKFDYYGTKTTLCNYLVWRAIDTLVPYLSPKIQNTKLDLKKALHGPQRKQNRRKVCVLDTNLQFGLSLGAIFVMKSFPDTSKAYINAMIKDIKKAFRENLSHFYNWLDNKTMDKMKGKVDSMSSLVGYPDFITIPSELDAFYEGVKMNVKDYFWNYLKINTFLRKKMYSLLNTTVVEKKWWDSPTVVNSFNHFPGNKIVFPVGYLQFPHFSSQQIKAFNYGGIGSVIGHEIMHGFDNIGIKYNAKGNWDPFWLNFHMTKKQLHSILHQCIIRQFSKYKVDDLSVRGSKVLGEAMSDLAGLKLAYQTYKKLPTEKNNYPALPILNLSNDQRFFLSFAQSKCSSFTKEYQHDLVLRDPHPPEKYRVIGTLSNFKPFAEAYNCPIGSPMNPPQKCKVW